MHLSEILSKDQLQNMQPVVLDKFILACRYFMGGFCLQLKIMEDLPLVKLLKGKTLLQDQKSFDGRSNSMQGAVR